MNSFALVLFTLTLFLETQGEPKLGTELVADVIANRAVKQLQPGVSIENALFFVILKPKQFSCWNNRSPSYHLYAKLWKKSEKFHECNDIAKRSIERLKLAKDNPPLVDDHIYRPWKEGMTVYLHTEATHYHSIHVHPKWSLSGEMVNLGTTGNHTFYRKRKYGE